MLAQRHGGDVQQPARAEIVGEFLQNAGEHSDGAAGAALEPVHAATLDWKQARVGVVVVQAVLLFAQAQVAQRPEALQLQPRLRRECRGRCAQ